MRTPKPIARLNTHPRAQLMLTELCEQMVELNLDAHSLTWRFRQALAEAAVRKHKTQVKAAFALGINHPTISAWLHPIGDTAAKAEVA